MVHDYYHNCNYTLEDFNDFPDEYLFANIQDSGDAECEQWKKRMSEA